MTQAPDSGDIVLVGAGGHARVIIDTIEKQNRYRIVAILDETPKATSFLGYPVLALDAATWPATRGLIAVGDNHVRRRLVDKVLQIQPQFRFVSAVHPSAQIARDVTIGAGTVVMAGVTVNTGTRIGAHCILNTRASLDHDVVMDEFASLGPGAITGGSVKIGAGAALAIGAVCLHSLQIGRDAVVGAGSIVTKDVPEKTVAYGNPCRPVRAREVGDRYL